MVVLQRTHPPGRQMYLRTGAFFSRVLVDGRIVRLAPIGRRRRAHGEVWCYVGGHGGTAYLLSLREVINQDSGTIDDGTAAERWTRDDFCAHHGFGARSFIAEALARACIDEALRLVWPWRR